MAEVVRLGRVTGTLRQSWKGQPVGTPWAAAVKVEPDEQERLVATFAVFVDGAGFALQDGVVLNAEEGEKAFEAAMTEITKRLGRFRGLFRGRTCLFRVSGHEWLTDGTDRGGLWSTGVIAEPDVAPDRRPLS